MATKATAILMDIIASDQASAVLKKVGGELKHTGEAAEKSGSGFSKFKAAGVAAGAAVGAAVIGFGKASVDKFKEVGGEVSGLMRVMGGTAESASRLRFAAEESGVSFETLSKSTGKLEKGLGAANDGGKKTAAMVKLLGFNFRDAHGHVRPMADILPQLADKFKNMPGGAEKTALAMSLFGKSGTDMLPFLNKGKAGIQDLMKETDKYGLTLTGKNLDALKKSKAGQREWNATLDGLKVQFGAQILPILTKFVGMLRDKVIPFVTKTTGFMSQHKNLVSLAAKVIVGLVAGLKAWSVIQGVLNVVLAANPIGLVVLAIGALVVGLIYAWKHSQTFRTIVTGVFNAIKAVAQFWWNNVLHPIFVGFMNVVQQVWQKVQTFGSIFKQVINAIKEPARAALAWVVGKFLDFTSAVLTAAAKAFGWVPGLGGKLKAAAAGFAGFRDSVNKSLAGVQDQTVAVAIKYSSAGVNLTTPSRVGGKATGSKVVGPGGPTDDKAGIWALSNGEWVIKTASSRKYGDRAMASVNAGTATIIPGFAGGGSPGLNLRTVIPSTAGTAKAVAAEAAAMSKPFLAILAKHLTTAATTGAGASSAAGAGSGVQRWSAVALAALAAAGAPSSWLPSLLRRMNQESGGNPRAINLWDSNAKAGHPSQGLMQTIPGTFAAYAGKYASRGILDPFANIYAAIRYTVARYGSGPAGWNRAGGYKHGTNYVPEDQWAFVHQGEKILPAGTRTGGAVNIYVTVPVGADPVGTGRAIVSAIKAYKTTTGGRPLGIG